MIDFCDVAPQHEQIHQELENWARWCHRGARGGGGQSPMFKDYRAPSMYDPTAEVKVVNSLAAVATQKRFIRLPQQNRLAIRWAYIEPWISPFKMQRRLAVTKEGLIALIADGRTMLKNSA